MPCADPGGPIGHLEDLGHELTGRGWTTSLLAPEGRRPALFVQNPDPEAAVLSDHVLVAPDGEGACWFWWSWASRIAPAGNVPLAAGRITHILRATEDHHSKSM